MALQQIYSIVHNADKCNSRRRTAPNVRAAPNVRDVLLAANALTALSDKSEQPENCADDSFDDMKGTVPSSQDARNEEENDENHDSQSVKVFPEKLMELLSQEDSSDAICWHPDGKYFVILNRTKLTSEVLPRFFKQTKFGSFVRKLYRWGFRQVENQDFDMVPTVGQMTFYHKYFQRGNLKLALEKVKSIAASKKTERHVKLPVNVSAILKELETRSKASCLSLETPSKRLDSAYATPLALSHFGVAGTLLETKCPAGLVKSWSLTPSTLFQKTAASRQLVQMSTASLSQQFNFQAMKKDNAVKNPYFVGGFGMKPKLSNGSVHSISLPSPESQPEYGAEIIRAAINVLRKA